MAVRHIPIPRSGRPSHQMREKSINFDLAKRKTVEYYTKVIDEGCLRVSAAETKRYESRRPEWGRREGDILCLKP